jgi:hypothetical protein
MTPTTSLRPSRQPMTNEQKAANRARAALPELIEACEYAQEWFAEFYVNNFNLPLGTVEAMARIDAALNKLRGES